MSSAVFAISGLSSLLIGWFLMFILPDARIFSWIIIGAGVLLIGGAFAMDFRRIKRSMTNVRGKFSISTVVGISLFVGIVVLVNAFSINFFYRLDLTGSSQFTLSSQTKEYLAKLDTPVDVITFFSPRVPYALSSYATSLLNEYQNNARHLTVRDIDPDVHPDEARTYGVDQTGAMYGTIVFKSGDRQRKVYGPQVTEGAEQAFTSAILEVTGTLQKRIYFLSGHGEGSIEREFSVAAGALRENLFTVSELDLMSSSTVP
ncbi:MAG: GldG family protein, partial [Rectinemataceae bacterium]|nr:GldG family protein [Rectinemataceae bacterium]